MMNQQPERASQIIEGAIPLRSPSAPGPLQVPIVLQTDSLLTSRVRGSGGLLDAYPGALEFSW